MAWRNLLYSQFEIPETPGLTLLLPDMVKPVPHDTVTSVLWLYLLWSGERVASAIVGLSHCASEPEGSEGGVR